MSRRMVAAGTILPDPHIPSTTRLEIRYTDGDQVYGHRVLVSDRYPPDARSYALRTMFLQLLQTVRR